MKRIESEPPKQRKKAKSILNGKKNTAMASPEKALAQTITTQTEDKSLRAQLVHLKNQLMNYETDNIQLVEKLSFLDSQL